MTSIVNPLLQQYQIPPLTCAIGMAGGEVVITKIGIPGFTSTKAIGESVNRAAKYTQAAVQPNGGILIGQEVLAGVYSDVPPGAPDAASAFAYALRPDKSVAITPKNSLLLPRDRRDFARLLSEMFQKS